MASRPRTRNRRDRSNTPQPTTAPQTPAASSTGDASQETLATLFASLNPEARRVSASFNLSSATLLTPIC
jgi:hypothetical protein